MRLAHLKARMGWWPAKGDLAFLQAGPSQAESADGDGWGAVGRDGQVLGRGTFRQAGTGSDPGGS